MALFGLSSNKNVSDLINYYYFDLDIMIKKI